MTYDFEIMRLIIMEIEIKTKHRSHRHDINILKIIHNIFETNSSFRVK